MTVILLVGGHLLDPGYSHDLRLRRALCAAALLVSPEPTEEAAHSPARWTTALRAGLR